MNHFDWISVESLLRKINGRKNPYASELENDVIGCITDALKNDMDFNSTQDGYIDEFLGKYIIYDTGSTDEALRKGLNFDKLTDDLVNLKKKIEETA